MLLFSYVLLLWWCDVLVCDDCVGLWCVIVLFVVFVLVDLLCFIVNVCFDFV